MKQILSVSPINRNMHCPTAIMRFTNLSSVWKRCLWVYGRQTHSWYKNSTTITNRSLQLWPWPTLLKTLSTLWLTLSVWRTLCINTVLENYPCLCQKLYLFHLGFGRMFRLLKSPNALCGWNFKYPCFTIYMHYSIERKKNSLVGSRCGHGSYQIGLPIELNVERSLLKQQFCSLLQEICKSCNHYI